METTLLHTNGQEVFVTKKNAKYIKLPNGLTKFISDDDIVNAPQQKKKKDVPLRQKKPMKKRPTSPSPSPKSPSRPKKSSSPSPSPKSPSTVKKSPKKSPSRPKKSPKKSP